MSAQTIFYSEYTVRFAMLLGRVLPPPLGYVVANGFAKLANSTLNKQQVHQVRANQWIIHQKKPGTNELNEIVRDVYQHGCRTIYDMYHNFQNMPAILKKISLSLETRQVVERLKSEKKGAILVGPHLSNFDLAIQSLAGEGLKTLVLSYPQPPPAYRLQNKLRSMHGVTTLPISISALHTAHERLKTGGVVLTGIDRPTTSSKYPVNFFGLPAFLPVVHVQLALNARVPVFVMACHMQPGGHYQIDFSEEITMKSFPDRQKEIVFNAEAILEKAQALISLHPRQWLMFNPVWPQFLSQVP